MKKRKFFLIPLVILLASCSGKMDGNELPVVPHDSHLFVDVHNLAPGSVSFESVSDAHQMDLATQDKYGVHFIKYWVDESAGKVYCLSESPDSVSVYNTHKEAHGLTPDAVYQVSAGTEANLISQGNLFLDIHYLGSNKVTAKDVAAAHEKDLAVQGKHNVNFVNYWVDETRGVVMCVSEAPDSGAIVETHKEAHGLIPDEVHLVKQGH